MVCSRTQCAQWMDYAISHISCSLGTRLWFLFENKKWIVPLKVVQQVRRRDDNSLSFHHVWSLTVFLQVQARWLTAAAQSAAVKSICLLNSFFISSEWWPPLRMHCVVLCLFWCSKGDRVQLSKIFVWTIKGKVTNKQILCVFLTPF